MRLLDSRQYQKHAIKKNYPYKLALRMYWRPFLACCTAWFLYDFVVYPFNFLAPVLVKGFSSHQTMLQSIGWSALVDAFVLPGALLGSLLVDLLGRKETYALGWGIVSILGFVVGGAMIKLHSVFPLSVVLYGLFQSFLSVGPGNNNFLVSSESFPTPIRGHFLGFAAAVGKAGAAIGTTVMSRLYDSYDDQQKGQQVLFLIASAISVVGTLVVWFDLPHYSPELENEDARFQAAMEAEGYAPNVEVQTAKVQERYNATAVSPANLDGPLRGIRILDFGRILAGPFCTQILADYGADVIKIEQPGIGDETRSWKGKEETTAWKPEVGPMSFDFASVNRSKRTSVSGYGSGGPYANRAGYDAIAAAEGGLMHITGTAGGGPVRPGLGMTDMSTGLVHPRSNYGEWKGIGPAVKFSESNASIRSRSPVLGEHTDDVLAEAGYGSEEMQRLREQGAI
ncbi:hypothetical protein KCU71_g3469, partial [Aureobasidium melanogenum]